jgi:hypothetical protein
MEMSVKSMETVVEAMESMEMAPGALPRPGTVPEQRLLSPEIRRWWRRSSRTLSQKTPIDLGFRVRRLYIGGEAASEGGQGPHTTPWRGQEGGVPPWCGGSLAPPPALLRSSSCVQEKYEVRASFHPIPRIFPV